eukprot:Gregarina_sp_Poly_1__7421@NODE_4116_length_725_cov_6_211246_g2696_i0_p1_GENE_NODE_4116_length_725_cov_6_211246_g2696_i0NODE_4116_length_725_cov_6_211246_g2696_i0_p1_ORF_typecomplete_len139_score13_51Tape_meas_lam_C/PF09718_10/0_046ToxODYAM1/PF15642_6/0_032Baculo_PEP_C/PF04513_12/0_12phiKZ_IP/PF12699_7/1_1e02phiKZ_IP/PF12699_7/2_2Cucumopine_C/PF18631_1/5_2e03Cucumopine_C/PF18631_1/0_1_NODE_4116_length_725_cov_6_211246_g2696_i0206622
MNSWQTGNSTMMRFTIIIHGWWLCRQFFFPIRIGMSMLESILKQGMSMLESILEQALEILKPLVTSFANILRTLADGLLKLWRSMQNILDTLTKSNMKDLAKAAVDDLIEWALRFFRWVVTYTKKEGKEKENAPTILK